MTYLTYLETDEQLFEASQLGRHFAEMQKAYDFASENLRKAKEDLIRLFPTEKGTHSINADGVFIEVTRDERWKWDSDKLVQVFAGDIPEYVKASLAIDKRKFKALPAEEQLKVQEALTVVAAAPVVKVTV